MTEHIHDIIVVDDHKSILDDFARLLVPAERTTDELLDTLAVTLGGTSTSSRGKMPAYRIHYAQQGCDAVAIHEELLAQERATAVAFVDIQMPPGIDGIETVARLWRAQPDLEIVLCTAYSDYSWHSILERLQRRDQLVILRKPFDPIEVRQLAACLSDKWSRGRALQQRMDALELQVKREVSRRLQLELRDLQKFEELGKVAAGIAHEINSPMQYIQSSIELVRESVEQLAQMIATQKLDVDAARNAMAEVPAALDDAELGVRRVTSIVRSVRDYAHTRKHVAFDVVDINAQIEMVAALVRAQYKHDVDLALDLTPDLRLLGDDDELSRALLNIVVNAAQAIQGTRDAKRGKITVRSRMTSETIVLEIEDSGKGIAREHWDKVFEPFFTTKPRGQGTGQGLAMAHAAIVEVHKGALTFDSVPGVGTTFRIVLPRHSNERTTVPPPFVGSAA